MAGLLPWSDGRIGGPDVDDVSERLPPKSKDFMEWYNEVVEVADLCDKRYPIKGMNVWRPYGWKIMFAIDGLTRGEMERTGHEEVVFPLLIPEKLFQKEADHIKGFGGEVFWVTHAGNNQLDERWLLRPTSETAMYDMFSLWVRSHQDLPLKTFQIVNTFRYDTKQTRAFMRVREIHFFEAHTCHDTAEDAERQIRQDLEIVENLFRRLGLPFVLSRRPDWDKFPGAVYSLAIDAVMPSGRTLQVGTVHQYHTNFSEPYDIKYEGADGKHHFVHQTTYGMSERILGALVAIHGDDVGILVPPAVAPVQVVVVPIIFKGKEGPVLAFCEKVERTLREAGIRVTVDRRDETAGAKFYEWERKGVPLRLEVGPRDVEANHAVAKRRDWGKQKETLPLSDIAEGVQNLLGALERDLWQRHVVFTQSATVRCFTMDDLKKHDQGVLEAPWCGREACGHQVEVALECATLGIPADEHADVPREGCVACGQKAQHWVRFAWPY